MPTCRVGAASPSYYPWPHRPLPLSSAAPAEAEAAEPPAEEAAAPAVEPPPPLENAELAAAVSANVEHQMAALKAVVAQEYAAQEQALLDRIAALEAKAK